MRVCRRCVAPKSLDSCEERCDVGRLLEGRGRDEESADAPKIMENAVELRLVEILYARRSTSTSSATNHEFYHASVSGTP